MDFVTIARFSNSFDMHVVKGRLEADGITCFVRDEHTITANPMYDIALGGIKLQVQEKDVAATQELLKDIQYEESGSLTTFNPYKQAIQAKTLRRVTLVIIFVLILLFFWGGYYKVLISEAFVELP